MTLKHSPELAALKERYKKHGLLLDTKGEGPAVKTVSLFGKERVISYGKASSGGWDDFTAIGSVHTNYLTIRKIVFLTDDDALLEGMQVIIGPFTFSWST